MKDCLLVYWVPYSNNLEESYDQKKNKKRMLIKLIYSVESTKVWQNLHFFFFLNLDILSYFCGILRIYPLYRRIEQIQHQNTVLNSLW